MTDLRGGWCRHLHWEGHQGGCMPDSRAHCTTFPTFPQIPLAQDPRDFADIVSPRMPFIYATVLRNRYYLKFVSHLIEGELGESFPAHSTICACLFTNGSEPWGCEGLSAPL